MDDASYGPHTKQLRAASLASSLIASKPRLGDLLRPMSRVRLIRPKQPTDEEEMFYGSPQASVSIKEGRCRHSPFLSHLPVRKRENFLLSLGSVKESEDPYLRLELGLRNQLSKIISPIKSMRHGSRFPGGGLGSSSCRYSLNDNSGRYDGSKEFTMDDNRSDGISSLGGASASSQQQAAKRKARKKKKKKKQQPPLQPKLLLQLQQQQKKKISKLPSIFAATSTNNRPSYNDFGVMEGHVVRIGVATPMSDISDLSFSAYSGTYGDFEDEVVNGGVDDDEYIL